MLENEEILEFNLVNEKFKKELSIYVGIKNVFEKPNEN